MVLLARCPARRWPTRTSGCNFAGSTRSVRYRGKVETYTDVGDDGIEAGEREPKRCVLRCWELRFASLFSFCGGLGGIAVMLEESGRSSGWAGAVVMMGCVPERNKPSDPGQVGQTNGWLSRAFTAQERVTTHLCCLSLSACKF